MFKDAVRERLKALVFMAGASGSGKTFSSLLMAKGIVKELYPDLDDTSNEFWAKIAVIDSEHDRSKIYAKMEKHGHYIGKFKHTSIKSPFDPKDYIAAVKEAKRIGIEVVIVDSTSHAWDYLKEFQQDEGGRYQDWKEPDKLYRKFINALTSVDVHLIATSRSKQKHALESSETGKLKVVKLGEQPMQRDSFEYEFLLGLLFDQDHYAHVTKDNTPLFEELGSFKIVPEHGQQLAKWLEKGIDVKAEEKEKQAAEDEEKASMINTIKSYTAKGNHQDVIDFTNDLIKRSKKTYKKLENMPLERLKGFVEAVHKKYMQYEEEENQKVAQELDEHQAKVDAEKEKELDKKTLTGLKEVAKSFKIKNYSKMKKEELIKAIEQAQGKKHFKRDIYYKHGESDSYVMFNKGDVVPLDEPDFKLLVEVSKEEYEKSQG